LIEWAGQPAPSTCVSWFLEHHRNDRRHRSCLGGALRPRSLERFARLNIAPVSGLASELPGRQTILVTGATGSSAAGLCLVLPTQVIRLSRWSEIRPKRIAWSADHMITSLDQLPADAKIDAIVNLGGRSRSATGCGPRPSAARLSIPASS